MPFTEITFKAQDTATGESEKTSNLIYEENDETKKRNAAKYANKENDANIITSRRVEEAAAKKHNERLKQLGITRDTINRVIVALDGVPDSKPTPNKSTIGTLINTARSGLPSEVAAEARRFREAGRKTATSDTDPIQTLAPEVQSVKATVETTIAQPLTQEVVEHPDDVRLRNILETSRTKKQAEKAAAEAEERRKQQEAEFDPETVAKSIEAMPTQLAVTMLQDFTQEQVSQIISKLSSQKMHDLDTLLKESQEDTHPISTLQTNSIPDPDIPPIEEDTRLSSLFTTRPTTSKAANDFWDD